MSPFNIIICLTFSAILALNKERYSKIEYDIEDQMFRRVHLKATEDIIHKDGNNYFPFPIAAYSKYTSIIHINTIYILYETIKREVLVYESEIEMDILESNKNINVELINKKFYTSNRTIGIHSKMFIHLNKMIYKYRNKRGDLKLCYINNIKLYENISPLEDFNVYIIEAKLCGCEKKKIYVLSQTKDVLSSLYIELELG